MGIPLPSVGRLFLRHLGWEMMAPHQMESREESMTAKKTSAVPGRSASELMSVRIGKIGGWQGATLARVRTLINEADPDVVEELKWMGTPVWSHDGIICTGEFYKTAVKLTFAKGAFLEDPARLFTSSLDGKMRRVIDIKEGEAIDVKAFKALIRAAVALNVSSGKKPSRRRGKPLV